MSLNSFGPLISLRLRTWRSSSVADGSLIRSISWAAISDAFAALFGADADDFAASRSTAKYGDDMIDPEWFPKTGKRRAGELSFRGKGNLL